MPMPTVSDALRLPMAEPCFWDEIANLPYYLQAKLLTAIQKRSFIKVGSNLPQPTNIRLICATNRDLDEMVRKGEFREDLLYRITPFTCTSLRSASGKKIFFRWRGCFWNAMPSNTEGPAAHLLRTRQPGYWHIRGTGISVNCSIRLRKL